MILESKLYKKYFPVRDENDKEKIVTEIGIEELVDMCIKIEVHQSCSKEIREEQYAKRLKRITPYSFFKESKSIHNRVVMTEMKNDRTLQCIEQNLCRVKALLHKYSVGEELSIEDINWILESENQRYYRILFEGLMAVLVVVVIAVIVL